MLLEDLASHRISWEIAATQTPIGSSRHSEYTDRKSMNASPTLIHRSVPIFGSFSSRYCAVLCSKCLRALPLRSRKLPHMGGILKCNKRPRPNSRILSGRNSWQANSYGGVVPGAGAQLCVPPGLVWPQWRLHLRARPRLRGWRAKTVKPRSNISRRVKCSSGRRAHFAERPCLGSPLLRCAARVAQAHDGGVVHSRRARRVHMLPAQDSVIFCVDTHSQAWAVSRNCGHRPRIARYTTAQLAIGTTFG